MNVRQIVIQHLKSVGADGLCNPDEDCGCDTDDLAPCTAEYMRDCSPAKIGEGLRMRPIDTLNEPEDTHS